MFILIILRTYTIFQDMHCVMQFLRNLTFESDSFFLKEVAVGVTSRLCRLNEQYVGCKK